MKKIKILIQGVSNNHGGIEEYIYGIYKNLSSEHFEISILSFNGSICFENEFLANNIKIFKITSRKSNYLKYLIDLINIFKNNSFDIIHFNIMDYSGFERILLSVLFSKANVIVHNHCGDKKYIDNKSLITKFLNFFGKHIVNYLPHINAACSEKAGKYMFNKKEYQLFYNGIDYEKFKYKMKDRIKIRNKYKMNDSNIIFGYVATFLPLKNHKFLIDLFEELIKINDNYRLFLIGNGLLLDDIIEYVNEKKLSKYVVFTGGVDNVQEFYSAFDIYLMPSLSESFGITNVEAQINGLNVISSIHADYNTKISDNIVFLDLCDLKIWINEILKFNFRNSENINLDFKYDKKIVYKKLADKYLEIMKGDL